MTRDRGASGLYAFPLELNKIPPVAIEILEDGDNAVRLMPRLLDKAHPALRVGQMVADKIVGFKEEKNPATALIADGASLPLALGAGKQQPAASTMGRNHNPPLAVCQRRIFAQFKPQRADKIVNGLIIIGNQQGREAQTLCHGDHLAQMAKRAKDADKAATNQAKAVHRILPLAHKPIDLSNICLQSEILEGWNRAFSSNREWR